MNPIIADLARGGAEGIFKGVGQFAKDVRSAITGNDPLTSEQKAALQQRSMDIELAVLQADQAVALGQIEVNKADASSGSIFRGGWRPAVGWVCVFGLGYQMIIRNILPWVVGLFGSTVPAMPGLELDSLMTLLAGMLGLGGFRTFERVKGGIK